MIRAIVVLVSTFAFTLVGLLVGWMSTQAYLTTLPGNSRASEFVFFMNYGVAPLMGAAIGFVVSVFVLWLFTIPLPREGNPHIPA